MSALESLRFRSARTWTCLWGVWSLCSTAAKRIWVLSLFSSSAIVWIGKLREVKVAEAVLLLGIRGDDESVKESAACGLVDHAVDLLPGEQRRLIRKALVFVFLFVVPAAPEYS